MKDTGAFVMGLVKAWLCVTAFGAAVFVGLFVWTFGSVLNAAWDIAR